MSDYWLTIGLVAVLVVVNAALSGSELALISVRESQLKQLEREGTATARRLVRLARDPNRFLATIQIGITLAGFLASATAAVVLAEPIAPLLGFLGRLGEPAAVALVTVLLAFVTLVLGELAPKRLALQWSLPWARLAAGPIDVVSTISRPVVWLLGATTNLVVRLVGGRANPVPQQLTHEELRDIVVSHRGLDAEQRQIIDAALEIHERTLREVLVPRRAVFFLREDDVAGAARSALAAAGHSRAPVVREHHLDDVVGVVHWAALTRADDDTTVRSVMAEPLVLPETVRVYAALRELRTTRQQLALVVDEHGSVEGIVSLEDLLEEIVGEIYDETDSDVVAVTRYPDGSRTLPGTFPLHDLVDVDIRLAAPTEHADFTTVAGLVLHHLGRIPDRPGDVVELPGWTIEVLDVDHHAITKVRFRPVPDRRSSP